MYNCTTCDVALLREQLSVFSVTRREQAGMEDATVLTRFSFLILSLKFRTSSSSSLGPWRRETTVLRELNILKKNNS